MRISHTHVPSSLRPGALALCIACLWFSAVAACKDDGPLQVTSIQPNQGNYMGGTYVQIFGNRFTRDGARSAKVFFGSRQAGPPTFRSDKEMVLEAPSAPGGKIGETVDVLIIFEPGGELTIPKAFTYIEQKNKTIDDISTKQK